MLHVDVGPPPAPPEAVVVPTEPDARPPLAPAWAFKVPLPLNVVSFVLPPAPICTVMTVPFVDAKFDIEAYAPPCPPEPAEPSVKQPLPQLDPAAPAPPLAPAPIASMVLLVEFQSLGTVHVVPEVR
jgi:hypothetical protein